MSFNRYLPRKWWRGWLCLLRVLVAGPLCATGRPWAEGILLVFVVFALCGCASFTPQPVDQVGVLARATTKEDGQVRVTVAVPSPEESAALFGVDVAGEGIQPVWLRIENHDDVDYFFLPISLDPHYFSSQEAAWKSRFFLGGAANEALAASFEARHIQVDIKAGEVREGFVCSNLDAGVKAFEVMLFHPRRIKRFDFVVGIPGIRTDYQQIDFAALQAGGVTDVDTLTLGRLLNALSCCVLGPDGATPGDPLNLVWSSVSGGTRCCRLSGAAGTSPRPCRGARCDAP